MVKSTAIRVGSLVALAVIAAAGVLFLRAIDTGSSASAAPAAQEAAQGQANAWLGLRLVQAAAGLTISAVIADSPADDAGLQRGDVITAVDGTTVETPQDEENQQGSGLVRGLEGVAADDQANATDASGNVTVVTVGTDGFENGGISSDSTSNSAALDPGSGRPGSGSSEG